MGVRFSPAPQSQCSSSSWQRTGAEHLGGFGCREHRVAPGNRRILIVRRVARLGEASRLVAATVSKTVCVQARVGSTPALSAVWSRYVSQPKQLTTPNARGRVVQVPVSKTGYGSSILPGYAMPVAQLARAYGYGHRVGGSSPLRHSQCLREEAHLGGDSFSVIASRRRRLHATPYGNN